MPASASIADWVGWMDFTSLDGVRKCLAINNRTGAGADTRLEFFLLGLFCLIGRAASRSGWRHGGVRGEARTSSCASLVMRGPGKAFTIEASLSDVKNWLAINNGTGVRHTHRLTFLLGRVRGEAHHTSVVDGMR